MKPHRRFQRNALSAALLLGLGASGQTLAQGMQAPRQAEVTQAAIAALVNIASSAGDNPDVAQAAIAALANIAATAGSSPEVAQASIAAIANISINAARAPVATPSPAPAPEPAPVPTPTAVPAPAPAPVLPAPVIPQAQEPAPQVSGDVSLAPEPDLLPLLPQAFFAASPYDEPFAEPLPAAPHAPADLTAGEAPAAPEALPAVNDEFSAWMSDAEDEQAAFVPDTVSMMIAMASAVPPEPVALVAATQLNAVPVPTPDSASGQYTFNPSRLAFPVDVEMFAHGNPVLPGTYRLDVMLNDDWMGKFDVRFENPHPDDRIAQPCFDAQLLDTLGFDPSSYTHLKFDTRQMQSLDEA